MPGRAPVLPVVDHDPPARQHRPHPAGDLPALVAGVVDVHVVRRRRQHLRRGRVVDDDVRVRARGDRALARVEPEHPGRGRAGQLDPAAPRDVPVDHALVQQVHPVLDARQPVRDLGEVAEPHLLLRLEAERAVVGRDHRQVVRAQPAPQRRLVLAGPQRGGADVLGALEPGPGEVVVGQEQVLRAGLGEGVVPLVARLRDLRQRLLRRQVHDVDGRVRDLRQLDRPVRRLGLQQLVADDAVVARVGLRRGPAPARSARRWRCRSRRA